MEYNDYNNELYHYGIKGQKWGVRRFQNADGTLTAKGEKRYAKNEAYREKLARIARKKADKYTSRAEEAEYNVKDLKKRGKNSEAYKKWKQEEDRNREREYESKNKVEDSDGNTYVKKYSTSGTRLFNEIYDAVGADSKVQDLIDENNATARRSRETAKNWTRTNKELMNMNVTALTKKSQIRSVYWSS